MSKSASNYLLEEYKLPNTWKWVKFEEIAKILRAGGTPLTSNKSYYTNGDIPFVKIEDITSSNKYLYNTKTKINKKGLENSSAWLVPENCILYSMYASYGEPIINKIQVATSQAIIAYDPPSNLIELDFIYYFLKRIKSQLKTRGTTQKNMNALLVKNMHIPLAPQTEQKRIVSKLEELFTKLDAGVEYLKKTRILLEQYRQSILKHAFEGKLTEKWREKNIDENESPKLLLKRLSKSMLGNNIQDNEILFEANGNSIPSSWIFTKLKIIAQVNPRFEINLADNIEVSFLPMKCVKEETGHIDLSLIRQLKEVKKGYTPFIDNDIIFAKITPCMENGKIAIVNNLRNRIGFGSTEFHVIRLKNELPRKYYFYYLLQKNLRKDAKRHMKGTAGQLRVSPMYMQDILIPFPSLKEQYAIIDEIERSLSVMNNIESNIETCLFQKEFLRQSILKDTFEGKLVPQNPNDEPAGILLERIKKEKESIIPIKKEKLKIVKKKSIDNDSKQMRLM